MKKIFAMLTAAALLLSLVTVPAAARTVSVDTAAASSPAQALTRDAATVDEALNVPGGELVFNNDSDYPWFVVGDAAQSGNGGVDNSVSAISTEVTAVEGDIVQFDFKCWGEGYSYDYCSFTIDGEELLMYGAYCNDEFETFQCSLTPGVHTLEWSYTKDYSVSPEGDYFMVDNVYVGAPVQAESIIVENVTVHQGLHAYVHYEVLPASTFDKSVTFAVEDESIATVDENGCVTGIAEGRTTVIVTSAVVPEVFGTANITVTEPVESTTLYGYAIYDPSDTFNREWVEVNTADTSVYVGHGLMPRTDAAAFAGGNVYGYLNDGDNRSFYVMDAETFEVEYYDTNANNVSGMYAMAYDHSTGTMYGLCGMGNSRSICTIDLSTGAAFLGPAVTGMNFAMTLAIDSMGNAYSVDLNLDGADLYRLDLETGEATLIGPTGAGTNYLQSMCFDHNTGTLYWAQCCDIDVGNCDLYIVDTDTGAATLLGKIGTVGVELTGIYTKNDLPIGPIEIPNVTITFVDGFSYEIIDSLVMQAGGWLIDSDFPEPPEHEGYEFYCWDYDGQPIYGDIVVTATYRDPNSYEATVVLNVPTDVWGDGSGYQMLLDFDAAAVYSLINPNAVELYFANMDEADAFYGEFEYKIPENADGDCNTENVIFMDSGSAVIVAGYYDYVITNPLAEDSIYIPSSNGDVPGIADDFHFEGGLTYTFTPTYSTAGDMIRLTISGAVDPSAPTVTPGDVDGNHVVNVADAILTLRAAMSLLDLTPEQFEAADVDGSGTIGVPDAILILRMAMGVA